MSSTRDPDLLIQAFLADGMNELPDRSFDAVRTAIDQTRQWAVVGPWKEPQIMTATRFALIAAAIAVVAVLAIRFLPTSGGIGGQSAPTTSPSPTPAPSPLSMAYTTSGQVPMTAGTYFVGDPFLVPLRFSVPSGWAGNVGGPYAAYLQSLNGSQSVSFTLQQSLYADACHFSAGLVSPSPGPAVDDLVTALTTIRGLTSTTPKDVSIGGFSAKQVTLTAPTTVSGCDLAPDAGGLFRLWRLPLGGTEDLGPGESRQLSIVAVNGQRLVLEVSETPTESASQKAEIQAIVDSIVIQP